MRKIIPAQYSICLIDLNDDPNINDVLNNYDIYDEDYRKILNNKILNHYAYQEIGFETPYLFAHHLKIKLDEIMPKYNMLYKSELLKIDPLSNFSYKENYTRQINGTAISSSQSSANSKNQNTSIGESKNNINKDITNENKKVFQNTPQGELSHETINNYSYATTHDMEGNTENQESVETSTNTETTNAEKNTNTNINDNTKTSSNEDYIKNIFGNQNITSTKLLKEFVDNFISIDKLIINELSDLFMGIY